MTKDEALNLALEFVASISPSFICEATHHAKKERHEIFEPCPHVQKQKQVYAAIKQARSAPVQEPVAWKNAAIRLGEELSSVGPEGYYNMTAEQWLAWALDQQPQGKNSLPAAPVQEPVACAVCNEVHAILDADESKIIRDAKDGYPDGRTQRILTLQERITALCVYASDWKRWCLEKENTTPPAQEFVCSTGLCHYKPAIVQRAEEAFESAKQRQWVGLTESDIKEIWLREETTYAALKMIEAKLKEKNT